MRTTLTFDDDLAATLKEKAFRTRRTFKEVLTKTLRAGLTAGDTPPQPKRYRVKPVSLGGVAPGIDLNKAWQLADALEDEAIRQKLELRK
jgi:hypothetical protein